jgi:hypothetical protein
MTTVALEPPTLSAPFLKHQQKRKGPEPLQVCIEFQLEVIRLKRV